jgi:hypothetical protein
MNKVEIYNLQLDLDKGAAFESNEFAPIRFHPPGSLEVGHTYHIALNFNLLHYISCQC